MTVSEYLSMAKQSTAQQIRHAIGANIEDVYAELVHLEAEGLVRLIATKREHSTQRCVEWAWRD